MQIINQQKLIDKNIPAKMRKLRRHALDILKCGVEAVDPKHAVLNSLKREDNFLFFENQKLDLNVFYKIYVIGGGKAGGFMAEAIELLLEDRINYGIINVLRGTEKIYKLKKIQLVGSSHPIPDEDSVTSVHKMASLIKGSSKNVLIIVLVSGGGSALMTYPAENVELQELKDLTERLTKCGATIKEINTVRKHLSAIKGGQLAKFAYPATIISLILSDVVGDPLDTIASGPTAPDQTTFLDAIEILQRYHIWDVLSDCLRNHLEAGAKGHIAETPKPDNKIFEKVYNVVVGNNLIAAKAAAERASDLGYNTLLLSSRIEGESRQVGLVFAGIAEEITFNDLPLSKPAAIIAGGETTVTVRGGGKGGRNQELVLSAATKIKGIDVVMASIATDGIDGPTEAAGGIIDGCTWERSLNLGLNPHEFLNENDSHTFFAKLDDAILTGPTGTNVNDLVAILVS